MNPSFDYYAKYYAVFHLRSLAESNPEVFSEETVSTLAALFADPAYADRRPGYFLFRLAAETLAEAAVNSRGQPMARLALDALRNVLYTLGGNALKAAAETLGALPLKITGPNLAVPEIDLAPRANLRAIVGRNGFETTEKPVYFGRSLVSAMKDGKRLLVFKLARETDSPESLLAEALWMEFLRPNAHAFSERFHIPSAIRIGRRYLFSLSGVPGNGRLRFHPSRYAICYIADRDYFSYPNHCPPGTERTDGAFLDILARNARLLGKLASMGIIHSAPIPLFHNRIQVNRRRDHGHYEWFRGGRLDRWLESCAYPNVGVTGIRDFEHLVAFNGPDRELYRHAGSQILSLLLLAGSWFRNKNRDRVGLDENGNPTDARHLFDALMLREMVTGVFENYYLGFCGCEFSETLPFDPNRLVERMIEEMGVDRYMEEILRVPDQNDMTDIEFLQFFEGAGYSKDQIKKLKKGESDIVIHTGPHLGGFNRPISLPELIEAVASMSALCIAGKYVLSK